MREAAEFALRAGRSKLATIRSSSIFGFATVIARLKYDKVGIKFKVTGKTEVTAARTASISGTTALTMPDFGFAEWVYGVFGYSAELTTDEQTALQTYLTAMTGLAV